MLMPSNLPPSATDKGDVDVISTIYTKGLVILPMTAFQTCQLISPAVALTYAIILQSAELHLQ